MSRSDMTILNESFNIYYNDGMRALENKDYSIAYRNLMAAAETLFKLAKISPKDLSGARIKRANDLYSMAKEIKGKYMVKKQVVRSASDDLASWKKSNDSREQEQSAEEDSKSIFKPTSETGVTFDDVVGLENVKEVIRENITEPLKHPELYKRYGAKTGGGVLLYGLPGTGKTMIAQAIAGEIDAAFFSIKCSDILSKWVGEAEQNIKELFKEASKYERAIIFFDEFDALATRRGSTNSSVMPRVVNELLAQMQGFEKKDNLLFYVAATNRPRLIDSAFTRPGRFNELFYVPLPDHQARSLIIQKGLAGVPIANDIDFGRIADRTEGFNGADLTNLCEKVKKYAIKQELKGSGDRILNDYFDAVLENTKSSVNLSDIEDLEKFEKMRGKNN